MASLGTPEEHPLKNRSPEAAHTALAEMRALPFGAGRPVPALVQRGQKKPPYPQKCPWCSYRSTHPPGLSRHIASQHPQHWRGTLKQTMAGEGPVVRGKNLGDRVSKLEQQREYNRGYRLRKRLEQRSNPLNSNRVGAPFEQPCIFCNEYASTLPMALAAHIRMAHKSKWKGNLVKTLGKKGADFMAAIAEAQKEGRAQYQRNLRHKKKPQLSAAKKRALKLATEARWERQTEPPPDNGAIPAPLKKAAQRPIRRSHIDYCPHCGHNLQAISIALGMMQGGEEQGG
jgi:hypothetical protein